MKIFAFLLVSLALAQAQPFYPTPAGFDTSKYLMPSDLEYLGAFRLPTSRAGSALGFTYTIGALTYTPYGDTAADGFPGALVIAGHVSENGPVAKISIPAPVASRTLAELPRAAVLQSFVRFGTFPPQQQRAMALHRDEETDTTYVAMTDAYLPTTDTLRIMSWGPPSLSSYGPMRWVGGDRVHCFGDYLFQIPKWWSDKYAPGRFLGMGRHRWGDLCGQGPAIYAMNPHADPADSLQPLSTVPMLRYLPRVNNQPTGPMVSYSHGGDFYPAAAFLESGRKSALLMSGRKGLGGGWYGTRCGEQGFHDTVGYRSHFIFYNPDELGRVAKGELAGHLPQPYAGLDITPLTIPTNVAPCDNFYIHALAYDRARNIIYGTQKYPGENQVVHAWRVKAYAAAPPADTLPPPADTLPPPVDTTAACPAPDTVTVRDTVVRVDSAALAAARDSLAGALRTLDDLSRQLADGQGEAATLRASRDSLNAVMDSLARRPPDTLFVIPRTFQIQTVP